MQDNSEADQAIKALDGSRAGGACIIEGWRIQLRKPNKGPIADRIAHIEILFKEIIYLNFKSFSFHPQLEAGILFAGYSSPPPIQNQAIPHITRGRDVIGLAQTGTGKTAAFVLPILHKLMKGPRRQLRVLIIVPTRELAVQIHQSIGILGAKSGLKSSTVYGGVGMNPQIQSLKKSDIVVACPGRLIDHIRRKTVDLSNVDTLILYEADQVFDMGFLTDIRLIIKNLPQTKRQTLLSSATMPPPRSGSWPEKS